MNYPLLFDCIMVFTLCFALFIATTQPKIPHTYTGINIAIIIIAILLFGLAPATEEVGTDRPNYDYMFSHANEMYNWGFRDAGFTYFLKFCNVLTGTSTGGFIVSAIIYILCIFYFYNKSFNHYTLYVLLLAFLSLGFTNHYYNVLRAGLSISILLVAYSKKQHIAIAICLSLIAISFHISALLIVAGYIITIWVKNPKFLYCFWGVMLLALLAGIFDSFEQYLNLITSVEDDRFNQYLSGNDLGYKVGLRLDFITYSFFPIVIGYIYIYRHKFKDEYYLHIYNMYLFINACWLAISKMPHNDRAAYLSWCLIPFILLYPIFNDQKSLIRNKKIYLVGFVTIIVGLNFYLKYLR